MRDVLKKLTLREKISLVSGKDFMYTNSVPRLGVRGIRMSDGSHGLRVQSEGGDNGVTGSSPATAFPTAAAMASGWNEENAYKTGVAIAEECLQYGVDVLLGPGTNIKRNPLGGRNFEYFSEDPYLAGKMAAAEVRGVQSKGVGATVKHFALNSSENHRFMGNSVCDMRAMREIYLKPFEIIVKESKPQAVMCAYNKVNGEYCSENKWLLTDILRDEWGFEGAVMSDWGATHDRVKGVLSGLDLEMPGDTAICRKWIADALNSGRLKEEELDKAVLNVLKLSFLHKEEKSGAADMKAHHALAAEIAADCAVLLKNEGVLPLKKGEKLCVLGDLFEKPRYQGAGSSMINPAFLSTPRTAFDGRNAEYVFARGYRENEISTDEALIKEALEAAEGFDKVIVFAGLTDYVESEGADREDMRLPENQLELFSALTKTGKDIIAVLYGGSPMELPFEEGVKGILDMYLPGQNGGEAAAQLLFGEKTPCGKLAETWPEKYDSVPFANAFGKTVNEIYKESVFVGYRYFLTSNVKVKYPFGYGLSYTSFDYRDMLVSAGEDEVEVSFEIVNTGNFYGAEIVQLYVKSPSGGVFRPVKELKGFTKVYLEAGKSKRVSVSVKKEQLGYWNVSESRYTVEGGEYTFELCSDCTAVRLSEKVKINGEKGGIPYPADINAIYGGANLDKVTDEVFEKMSGLKIPDLPAAKPISMESRFTDLKQTFFGRRLFRAVLSVAEKKMKKAKRLPDGAERDNMIKGAYFLKRVLESNSLISMSMCAGNSFPYNFGQGFKELANGRIIRGIKCFCTKIKEPALPDETEEK